MEELLYSTFALRKYSQDLMDLVVVFILCCEHCLYGNLVLRRIFVDFVPLSWMKLYIFSVRSFVYQPSEKLLYYRER